MGPAWDGTSAAAAARTHGTARGAAGGAARGGGTRGTRPRRRASPAPPACRPLCHRAISSRELYTSLYVIRAWYLSQGL